MKYSRPSSLPLARISTAKAANEPFMFNLPIKYLSLIVLILQNSALVLMMRYSRMVRSPDQSVYIASTAVVLAEIIKLPTCLFILYKQSSSWASFQRRVKRDILQQPKDLLLMAVPSALYAIQNNLLYIALSNLEAASFQVIYQVKILSTAIFSVIILGRRIMPLQWLSLGLLMLGVTFVQLQTVTSTSVASHASEKDLNQGVDKKQTQFHLAQDPLIGFGAVMIACLLSGFAGCYFERVLKTTSTSMWIRNIQLGISGGLFSILAMLVQDRHAIMKDGMLQGYNMFTWLVLTNQALGGILVAIVVKYADNILKGFATSISIILSGVISYMFFGFQPSGLFLFGTAIVIAASTLYGKLDNRMHQQRIDDKHISPVTETLVHSFYDKSTVINNGRGLLSNGIDPKYAQLLTRRGEYHI
ncbi:nucleotide-sugar transporter-domain-containing protein [Syncephalis fuscata]|nr:nucleotide-sugar transporter-domain-containing protein [Syncephalis fuscata]